MSIKIVAVRADFKGDDVVLTMLGETPRGTRVRVKSETVSGVKGDRAAWESKVAAAIDRMAPRGSAVPE